MPQYVYTCQKKTCLLFSSSTKSSQDLWSGALRKADLLPSTTICSTSHAVPASIRGSQAAAPAQSISPSHRGATSIPATSSSATTHTRWVISTTAFRTRNFATGSHAATLTAVPNARTAGQSSTAPAVVRQIPIMLQATSTASTRWDAISSERG